MAKDYSYNELLNMQEQAMRRVEQMQSRTNSAKESFMNNSSFKEQGKPREEKYTEKNKRNIPDFLPQNPPPLNRHNGIPNANANANANINNNNINKGTSMFSSENPIKGLLDGLNLDDDKLLLIGILLLLSQEGADNSLIFSILYMLF